MEAVIKLSRAEVEEACAQYLARRDVRFASTPKLVEPDGAPKFEFLYFSAEIAMTARPAVDAEPPALRRGTSAPAEVPYVAGRPFELDGERSAESATLYVAGRPFDVAPDMGLPAPAPAPAPAPSLFAGSAPPTGDTRSAYARLIDPDAPPSIVRLPEKTLEFRRHS